MAVTAPNSPHAEMRNRWTPVHRRNSMSEASCHRYTP